MLPVMANNLFIKSSLHYWQLFLAKEEFVAPTPQLRQNLCLSFSFAVDAKIQ